MKERSVTPRVSAFIWFCVAALYSAGSCVFAEPHAPEPVTSAPESVLDHPAPAFQTPTAAPEKLRHLTSHVEGFRLSGETATTEWPIYLTDAQTKEKLRFRLGYLTAISVAPELSTLKVMINDVQIASTLIAATADVRSVEFDVPPALLEPGYNAVRISVDQRHRVDCSLAATYELWTQIDPAQSGFVTPSEDPGAANLTELAALSPDERGAMPIRVVLPLQAPKNEVERAIHAVQMIAVAGHFSQPLIDFGGLADDRYGLNLVVGTTTEVSSLLGDSEAGAKGPRAVLLPMQGDRRATLIVSGANEGEIDQALGQLPLSTVVKGSPSGLRAAAAFPGYSMTGGQRVKLGEIGVASQEFSGRLFRAGFNIVLPADFYPADYGKAMLDLAGGYAPGLTQEAQIVVSVNGRDTTSIRLPKTSGDVYDHNPVPLPLGSMRPGLNRIEIEAQLPMSSDTACVAKKGAVEPPRFLLLDSTQLEIPRIARVATSPDLAASAIGGFPFLDGAKPPILVVPAPENNALGAAATIAARFAVAAGRAIDFRLENAMPDRGAGATLVVGAADDLDPDVLRAMSFSKSDLDAAWGKSGEPVARALAGGPLSQREKNSRNRFALQRNIPASCQIERPAEGFARHVFGVDTTAIGAVKSGEDDAVGRSLHAQWDDRVGRFGLVSWMGRTIDSARDWIAGRYEAASAMLAGGSGGTAAPLVTRRSSLAVGQSNFGASADDVVTLFTAANAGMLFDSIGCLVEPRVWRNLAGGASVLDSSDGSIKSLAPEHTTFITTQPLTVANVRLIAAGWLSLNANAYVSVALLVVLALSSCTLWFVRNAGRRAE